MGRYVNLPSSAVCGNRKTTSQKSAGIWTTVGGTEETLPRRPLGKAQRVRRRGSGCWASLGQDANPRPASYHGTGFCARGPRCKALCVDKWYIPDKLHRHQLCKSFHLTHLRNHEFQYFFTQSIKIVGSGTWGCILILHPTPCKLSTATIHLVELREVICFICTLHAQLNIKSTSI